MLAAVSLALLVLVSGNQGMKPHDDFASEFDAISGKCHTPRLWLRMGADGFVKFTPPETAKYSDVMCIVAELRKRQVPMKTAFISNGS